MARIVGGIGCSHAPSIAHSYDRKLQKDPMWAPLYEGWEPAKEWLTRLKPDLMVVVYNDHMNRFFFDAYPSFALGAADTYPQADEGELSRFRASLVSDSFSPSSETVAGKLISFVTPCRVRSPVTTYFPSPSPGAIFVD